MKIYLNIINAFFLMMSFGLVSQCKDDVKKEPKKTQTKIENVEDVIIDSDTNWIELKSIFLKHYQALHPNRKQEIEKILNQQILINVPYYGYDRKKHIGQLVCNQSVKIEIEQIFKELFAIKFPIYSVIPISQFQFEDTLSMQANNTTCFDYRLKVLKNGLSKHAKGLAMDINPMQNPYFHKTKTEPKNHQSELSIGRIRNNEQMGKNVIQIYKKYGWKWGGSWKSAKDYMHFEK